MIDIAFLKKVKLSDSFECLETRSVTSILITVNEWIDVSRKLAKLVPTVYDYGYIESIESNVTSIHLPAWTCNDPNYTTFDFSRFTLLAELEIGDNSFKYVNLFNIDGLSHLKSLKIGKSSFTKESNSRFSDESRSFHVLNCIELESIEIGEWSFCDYAGGFELINLPKLSTIKIGEIGMDSSNFYYSSFVIKGIIDMILLMNRSSTFEFYWIRLLCIWWIIINIDIKYLNYMNE